MVKNRFKERITECAFDNEPLRKVYEMICNLETPYIYGMLIVLAVNSFT